MSPTESKTHPNRYLKLQHTPPVASSVSRTVALRLSFPLCVLCLCGSKKSSPLAATSPRLHQSQPFVILLLFQQQHFHQCATGFITIKPRWITRVLFITNKSPGLSRSVNRGRCGECDGWENLPPTTEAIARESWILSNLLGS